MKDEILDSSELFEFLKQKIQVPPNVRTARIRLVMEQPADIEFECLATKINKDETE